jgi:hypothetical protein
LENVYTGKIGPAMQDILKDPNWGRYNKPEIPRTSFPNKNSFFISCLESGREYAIVILSPASDAYEMWTATMGQKQLRLKIYQTFKMLL